MPATGPTTVPPGGEPAARRVALLTLGCARNEVDSEELAARLANGGWQVTADGTDADVVLVNTCGFIAKAKQDSIDTLLAAADTGAKVVATGCLAERYGAELAASLPEAAAVLGFDHYPDIAARLGAVLDGESIESHAPRDRRTLLPLAPVDRGAPPRTEPAGPAAGPTGPAAGPTGPTAGPAAAGPVVAGPTGPAADAGPGGPTPAHLRPIMRKRLEHGPVAPLKLASGCDRRCAFCAIPSFRGAFVSRSPDEILAEAEWLAADGVRELVLVSENSTSYGKDLGEQRLLERLLRDLATVRGIARVRVSYLQPAEVRPGLIEAIATTLGVAPYFDLSFQHSSEPVLRRMRRFGSTERFLELITSARSLAPDAGIRSNVIVGFPGETRADVAELERFLTLARLDAVGVFDYSDEDGTEAATMDGKVSAATVKRRYTRVSALAEQLCAQRAAERIGSTVEVLIDATEPDGVEGRAAHQAPEVDGSTTLVAGGALDPGSLRAGDLVRCTVVQSDGVDLVAVPFELISGSQTVGALPDRVGS
jgi:ribosomal protein S12 methylthiotransferase